MTAGIDGVLVGYCGWSAISYLLISLYFYMRTCVHIVCNQCEGNTRGEPFVSYLIVMPAKTGV
jgi:hypothetical protein